MQIFPSEIKKQHGKHANECHKRLSSLTLGPSFFDALFSRLKNNSDICSLKMRGGITDTGGMYLMTYFLNRRLYERRILVLNA